MAQELVWERSGHPQIQLLVVTITTLVPEASYPPAPMPATAVPREGSIVLLFHPLPLAAPPGSDHGILP